MMEGHAHRLRARLTGGVGEADALYAAAERLFESLDLGFWLAVTRLEHAESLVAGGGDAGTLARDARETFVRLGATPWVARADAVSAQALASEPTA
jgi:hypothetical protein